MLQVKNRALVAFVSLATCVFPSFLPPFFSSFRQQTLGIELPYTHPRNGSTVPGDSLVVYNNDPRDNLFQIEYLNMKPSPCVIESYCSVEIRGRFTESLVGSVPQISFQVRTYFDDGRQGAILGADDLCNWIDVEHHEDQDEGGVIMPALPRIADHPYDDGSTLYSDPQIDPKTILQRRTKNKPDSCAPKEGDATIGTTLMILDGWTPLANYTVRVKATAEGKDGKEGRIIFDLRTAFEMKYRDGYLLDQHGLQDVVI